MKRGNLKIVALLIAACGPYDASIAQSPAPIVESKYRAVHWVVEDGLAHGKTYSMLKDINGFLWIGTEDGLSRFDGSTFKNYDYDPKKTGTISGMRIQGLVEDSLHNIWIGTEAGLSRYDIKADTFTNFLPIQNTASLSSRIVPFWATKNEIYCIETDSLITTYDIHSLAKTNLVRLTADDKMGHGDYCRQYAIFDVSSNSVWMQEECSKRSNGGLVQISLSSGERGHYDWPCYKRIPHHCHWSEGTCYDRKRNAIWLNSPDGLTEFTLKDKQFHHIDALNDYVNLKSYSSSVGIGLDPLGRLWMATNPRGILMYDPTDESVKMAFPADSLLQQSVSQANGCIYCDRTGIIWSGYWLRKGVYQFVPCSQPVTRYLADTVHNDPWRNIIFNCIPAGHDEIWMGTDEDGILIFNSRDKTFKELKNKEIRGMKEQYTINPISVDGNTQKALVIAKQPNTLYVIDIHAKKCMAVIFKDFNDQIVRSPTIQTAKQFGSGCLILTEVNEEEKVFEINTGDSIAKEILAFPKNTIDGSLAATDGDHTLFLKRPNVLGDKTYSLLNGRWIENASPLDSIHWNKIVYNHTDASYWAISLRKLYHYDNHFILIRQYGPEDGLPSNKILILIADNRGNLWFNTNTGIYCLNIESGIVTNLSEKDGFKSQDFRDVESAMKYPNGDLYFPGGGTAQGFDVIDPGKYVYAPATVYLKSLQIKQFDLPQSLSAFNLDKLTLKYFQNRINIETGTIDYYSGGKTHIRYRLDRPNAVWQYAPANYIIRYEDLPPGKYTLLMQAGNASNEFYGPVRSLIIQITPAFWNMWWFRILAGICLVAPLYALIRHRLRQNLLERLERSEKERQLADMGQKTAELQQQKTELEMQALRAQMNPHFIFNSLNSINRFILQNNKPMASEYLTKFSKLVRMILQNSQTPLITLESELEALKLYLEMESLRFNFHFDYKISVPDDIDIDMLKVPPLIIQPYVENAIWHGLMHKEEKGQLDIEVSKEEEFIYFKISDNGIGRKQAAALSSKSATTYKSMGLRITADRIAILQGANGIESPVTINDLANPEGIASGTEVTIKIPAMYD
jgi:ligand-binding sensor domain-containing protein